MIISDQSMKHKNSKIYIDIIFIQFLPISEAMAIQINDGGDKTLNWFTRLNKNDACHLL